MIFCNIWVTSICGLIFAEGLDDDFDKDFDKLVNGAVSASDLKSPYYYCGCDYTVIAVSILIIDYMKKLETGLREKQFSGSHSILFVHESYWVFQLPFLQALDSDGEETAREASGGSKPKNNASTSDGEKASGLNKPAISEGSSDGELVEIPDQESDTAHKKAMGAAEWWGSGVLVPIWCMFD